MDEITLDGIQYPMSDIKDMQLVFDETLDPARFVLRVCTYSHGALPDMEATAENLLSYGLWSQARNARQLISLNGLQNALLKAKMKTSPPPIKAKKL